MPNSMLIRKRPIAGSYSNMQADANTNEDTAASSQAALRWLLFAGTLANEALRQQQQQHQHVFNQQPTTTTTTTTTIEEEQQQQQQQDHDELEQELELDEHDEDSSIGSPELKIITNTRQTLSDRLEPLEVKPPPISFSSNSAASGSGSGSASGCGDNFVHYCHDCGKRYSTSSNLARHRQTHRDVTDKKAKKCPVCDKIYVSMPAFAMHQRTHNQGCICSICGKSFSRPWLLQGHMRTHTGEKPFRCKTCDKAFADKSNLRAHIQTHSTTKPYVCQRCNKAFALKSYLCKHVESTCMRANGGQREPLNLKISRK